jgi:hypothetical protein
MDKNLDVLAREILIKYDLDFRIEKLPSVALRNGLTIGDNGGMVECIEEVKTPYFMLYNDKTGEIINSVKKGYTVSQNDEIVELMLEGIGNLPSKYSNTLDVVKGGSINGGRKVFLQLSIEGDGDVNGDVIKRYITLVDSNDGSTGLSVGVGDLTVSCMNQFYQFYKDGQSKLKHTASLNVRKGELPTLIERQLRNSLNLVDTYNKFSRFDINDKTIHRAVKTVYGYSRLDQDLPTRVENVLDTIYGNIGHQISDKGKNLWGLHSGFTRWSTHDRNAPKRDNGRVESLMLSGNYTINDKSFKFAASEMAV